MKNAQITNPQLSEEEIKIKNSKEIEKRKEIEKELNIIRNHKNKNNCPNLSDIKKNQLSYYNKMAKSNIHNLMNNPTLKDIIRITSNESVFDQLKAKEKSKDLSKFLEGFPLKRVERINYKCLEIGQMRKDLGALKNQNVNYNKEKCHQFAKNLFEKRKRNGSINYIPVLTIDNINLYNQNNKTNFRQSNKLKTQNNNNLVSSQNEIWIKKYKNKTHNGKKNHKKTIYNSETGKIKLNDENLSSNKIIVNKYKKDFEIEDKDKGGHGKMNGKIDDYQIPKRTLTSYFSRKIKIEKNNNEFLDNFFSNKDLRTNISISKENTQNKNVVNNKGSSINNNEMKEIKVRKKEEKFN